VPFRLLGVIPHVEDLPTLAGRAFNHYAESAVHITVACTGGADLGQKKGQARSLGIHDLIGLDYRPAEVEGAVLAQILADIMRAVRPQVVVAGGEDAAVFEATRQAFHAVRAEAASSAALPGKLYRRLTLGSLGSLVTTTLPGAMGSSMDAERFVRVFPNPWVTGVLERDLFAGIGAADPAVTPFPGRLAS
jgi:hypothetical protein